MAALVPDVVSCCAVLPKDDANRVGARCNLFFIIIFKRDRQPKFELDGGKKIVDQPPTIWRPHQKRLQDLRCQIFPSPQMSNHFGVSIQHYRGWSFMPTSWRENYAAWITA